MNRHLPSKSALSIAVLLLVLAVPALGQLQSGNLYGTVESVDDKPLPGVTVTLTGAAAPLTQATDADGKFRFLGLSPGTYTVHAEIEGYSPAEGKEIAINIGRNTSLEIALQPAITGVIDVIAEPPLLDNRRIAKTDTVTLADLERIPTARDPWAVLQTAPGVLTDRINVGGNESGQQSNYVGPGSCGCQAVWSLDGVTITDMSATGSSPGYYDFDSFEEMQVSTGGSDASLATGGVVMNMVTKRGGNEWRGSARYYETNDSTQSDLELDRGDLGQAGPWNNGKEQEAFQQGNRIVEMIDLGAELGGPLIKDKLWVWGAYARPEISLLTISDFSDDTTLEDWNVKLNAQLSPSNSATAFAWQSDKIKIGRNAGPLRPQETTWDQSGFGPGPTAYKVEDTQIFGSDFFITGMYSVVNGGFQLVPQGGEAVAFRDRSLQFHNSFFLTQIERPQEQVKADAAAFFNTGSLSHELKFGAGYRTAEQSSLVRWPAGALELIIPVDSNPANDIDLAILARDATPGVETEYTSAYLQDTFAAGNLTANLGVRYDRQGGENLASRAGANPILPDLLPAVDFAGGEAGFTWDSITPRLGLTYALGKERETLLRASYSRFADQLGTGNASFLNTLGGLGYAYFLTNNNGDPVLRADELGTFLGFSGNVNPLTGQPLQSNAVDPALDAPLTDELLLGIEHALRPDFMIGLNLTYRKLTDILEAERLVFDANDPFAPAVLGSVGRAHRRDDYVEVTTDPFEAPDGRTYDVRYFELRNGVSTRDGFLLENGDREQEYTGASLVFNKRLANRWMLRGNLSWQDWTWQIPDGENEDPTDTIGGGIVDGTDVLQGSGNASGPKGNVFISSGWSYNVNGMYQIAPQRSWGFNLSANLTGREGYPLRYVQRIVRQTIVDAAGTGIDIPIDADPNAFRYPDAHVLDLRAEKEFRFSDFGLTLGLDLFNALNESYVLQRQGVLARDNADHVLEILSPRVYRLGARLSFR